MLLRPRTYRATAQMNVSESSAALTPMSAGAISHGHEKSCG
jgi:hypothetical protein